MITYEQATAKDGSYYLHNRFHDSRHKTWRRNGRTKTWKTRPGNFRIPVKHGLYVYGVVDHLNANEVHLEEECNVSV